MVCTVSGATWASKYYFENINHTVGVEGIWFVLQRLVGNVQ